MIVIDRKEPMPPHQQAAFASLLDALQHLRVAMAQIGGDDITATVTRAAIRTGIDRIERLAELVGGAALQDNG